VGQTTIYLQSLYFLFFGLTPATARFPFGVISIASLFFFYLIIKGLLNKRNCSLFFLCPRNFHLEHTNIKACFGFKRCPIHVFSRYFLFLRSKKTAALIISMLFFFLAFL